jgi:hypothetical protein
MTYTSPDTPALRGLLTAISEHLTVPEAAHHADDDLHHITLQARAGTVRLAVRCLLDGPLDNVAIQSYARMLAAEAGPVHYATAPAGDAA